MRCDSSWAEMSCGVRPVSVGKALQREVSGLTYQNKTVVHICFEIFALNVVVFDQVPICERSTQRDLQGQRDFFVSTAKESFLTDIDCVFPYKASR